MRFSIIILALCMMPIAYAISPVLNGEFFSGSSIVVDNRTFIIIGTDSDNTYWNNYSAVVFKDNDTNEMFTVKMHKCYALDYYDYCYNGTNYNWKKNLTYEGEILEPSLLIKVYYNKPEITIQKPRSVILEYGKTYFMNIKLKNTGTEETTVNYQELLPNQFTLSNCFDCIIQSNMITSSLALKSNEEKNISYGIRYSGYSNWTWSSFYEYTYDDKTTRKNQTTSTSVKKPYTITESFTSNIVKRLGEPSKFTVVIANQEQNINMDVELAITNQFVIYQEGLEKDSNRYTYSGTLFPNQSKTFSMTMESSLIGAFPIIVQAKMKSRDNIFEYYNNYTYNVIVKPLLPIIIIDKTKVYDNESIKINVSLKNPDNATQYISIYAYVSPINQSFTFDRINPGRQVTVYNGSFEIPENSSDFNITISGTYRTTNYQDLSFKLNKTVDVLQRKPVVIKKTPTVKNTTKIEKNTTSVKKTTPTAGSIPEEKKKDFFTSILDFIDGIMKSIFG